MTDAAEAPIAGAVLATSPAARAIAGLSVVLYLRASLDRTGEESSVETQDREGMRFITAGGATLLGTYRDNNIGASDPARRPGFSQMLEDIESGRVKPDLIVCFDISRLYRNDIEKRRLERLFEQGTYVLGIWDGVDTRDPLAGRIVWDIVGRISINKRAELARSIGAAARKNREKGIPQFSRKPFAYDFAGSRIGRGGGHHNTHFRLEGYGDLAQPEIDELIASGGLEGNPAHLRWGIEELLRASSLNSVATAWNDEHGPHYCLPTRSTYWHRLSARTVLTAARNAGCTEDVHYLAYRPETWQPTFFRDEEWEAEHGFPRIPALMTVEELLRVRRWLELRGEGLRGRGSATYLLSHQLHCAVCGHPLVAGTGNERGRNFRYFYCDHTRPGHCPRGAPNYVRMELVDEIVSAATIAAIASGTVDELLERAATEHELGPLMHQIHEDETYLQRFRTEAIEARLPLSKINELLAPVSVSLEQNAARLEQELRRRHPLSPVPTDLRSRIEQHWAQRDIAWRREMISLVWSRIEIRPGHSLRGVSDRARRLGAVADRLTLIARTSL